MGNKGKHIQGNGWRISDDKHDNFPEMERGQGSSVTLFHSLISVDRQPGWAHVLSEQTSQPCGSAESFHTGVFMIPDTALKRKIPPDLCLGSAFGGGGGNHSNKDFKVTEGQAEKLTPQMGMLDT